MKSHDLLIFIADSDSEEEMHCFEIKKRIPLGSGTQQAPMPSGRVNKVVAAFEAGLSLAQESLMEHPGGVKAPSDYAAGMRQVGKEGYVEEILDEYGSNMMHPAIGARKRSLEHVGGDLGIPPSPKKQFVEVDDVSDQVEEASLEWPQADK